MSFPYKNPISSIQVNGTQTVPRNNTYGTTFSVNNTGGYMEVYSLSDLYYTIPSGTTGSIEYSGNTIPIEFTKGTGAAWSPNVITLASDNISSGRRRLGMLVYVYEQDQVYQYYINNYETLFNAATASTGCVRISDFGTTINNKTAAGQSFINAWTGNTIEDVSGATHATAVWRKFSSGASSGGTSGTSLYIVGTGINSTVRCGVNNTAKGDYGASLGGSGNTALGKYSFVGGGRGNTASNAYSTVGGGYSNTAIGDDSTVSGGQSNTSSGCRSTVSGGYLNTSSNYYSTVSGGRNNTSSGNGSTVSGGYCNTSSGTTSTISGGYCNINGGDSAFIGAGRCNTMVGITGGIIGGGSTNTVSSNYSVIGGGAGNTVSGYISFVGGGSSNTASGDYSNVSGGRFNTVSGYKSTISGGYCNRASGNYSFIGGGNQNTISTYPSFSSILNGCLNTISGASKMSNSVVIGGLNNIISDSFIGVFGCNIVASCPNTFYTNNFCSCGSIYSSTLSSGQAVCSSTNGLLTNYTPVSSVIIQGTCTTSSIRCGVANNATADFSASLAGTGNTASGLASVVVGGAFNNTYSTYSFVGGGIGNKSCGSSASVVGGGLNTSCCSYSFIGGGLQNITSGVTSSVVGGCKNTAGGNCSFIGGGTLNIITSGGSSSFIGTGRGNTVSGNYSMVLGGSGNTVSGSFSSAIGCGLNATANCTLYTNNIITGTISATTYNNLPSFSGGSITGLTINGNLTVTGNTSLQALTATTISATTYFNLPVSAVTSGTGISASTSNGVVTITNTLPDQTVTITGGTNIQIVSSYPNFGVNFTGTTGSNFTGGTVSGATNFTGGLSANTISATTYNNLPSFSGGTITGLTINGNLTVTGNTSLQALTATTISATTYSNLPFSGTVRGGGTSNYIPKWTGTTALGNSQIQDDGTNIGVSVAPSASYKMYVYSSVNSTTLNVQNQASGGIGISSLVNGGGGATGISSSAFGGNGFNNTGILGVAQDGLLAIGVKGALDTSEFGGITTGIGGYFDARAIGGYSTPLSAYSVQLLDGTEGVNKVLLSTTSDGKANWSSTLTGLTNVRSTTISATTYNNLPSFSGGTITGLTINGNLTVTGNTSLQALTATTISATTLSSPFTTGSVIFQGSGGTLSQNNSNFFWDNTNNRLGILTSSPSYGLDVSGTARVQNHFYQSSGFALISLGNTLNLRSNIAGGSGYIIDAQSYNTLNSPNNEQGFANFLGTYAPTSASGTPSFNALKVTPTINQTGGSSGVTRGIYVNPTISAATDFRAIETTIGNVMLNTVSGNTLIGTTANTGTYKLDVRGATRLSATTGTSLTVISSGNSTSAPVFSVQGSQGELFSVTDSLTGSLFSVSDISGLPILEVFSDSTTIIGDYQAPSLYTTKRVTSITASTGTTIYSFPTSAYTSSFVDYYVSGSTGLRAGNMMAIWSGSTVNFTETSTNDIGVTTPVTFGYVMSGSSAVLRASASTGTWIVESILRGL